ncbi:RabGAP/TBC [Meira miltonrushii]|uniref:RabGAP/TBC n=1 Tax=Meira miltonrushii TaxID=1280837 RepID=A0A316VN87_9BASI|nr:RabGAP/TBC [Meira miltonrushii]PWN37883.1 RabGAP/TBC [Meira miltonrushii]
MQQEDAQAKDEGTPDTEQGAATPQKAARESQERASVGRKADVEATVDGGNAANKEEITTPEEADANKSPVLTDAADKERKHRRGSSHKPSALEQHLSRTRMTNLPPKPKVEDTKHLHDFEEMMKLSKEMSLKKQQEEEEKKNKKDASLQERMKVWESEILPSWTRARRETRLRRLWWKGIPPNLRGRVWALACGNSQMLPRNLFNKSSAEAKEMRSAGTFPKEDLIAIEEDIGHTLPTLRLFQKETGPLYDDLFDLLCAFTIVANGTNGTRVDELDYAYPVGVASLAAMLLMNLSPSESLIALINLIADRPWLRALYSLSATANTRQSLTLSRGSVDSFERVFDTLLADQMPKVYANMQARGVRPSAYVNDWIRTLFVPFLPFDAVARLWDCILLEESDALLFRTGIALVSLLSARLYVPEKDELISILRGNNRAAISAPEQFVPLDDIYGGQYGITENILFRTLEEQDSWWKDSVLERLLDREIVS